MSDTKDGGPAFPRTGGEVPGPNAPEWVEPQAGMSLRDWFAGQALASIMQDKAIWDSTPDEELDIAHRMYRWADAMLAARAKP